MDNHDDQSEQPVRQIGTGMIIAGWLIAFALVAYVFDGLVSRQVNPNDERSVSSQRGNSELVLRANRQNQYLATGLLNGISADFLLDTGATQVAVSTALAQRAGLQLGRAVAVETAGGITTAYTTVVPRIDLGPLVFHDIDAVVIDELGGYVLLGMNALADLTFTQRDDQLFLQTPGRQI
ncbi:MAG: TIGR02281 family clan AA aspartic protease [Betaproteobacteria bacterium]|nr:TIGR02281 family clan AA aspartic protease [Betaproteobacteria bacterium]